MGRRRLVYVRLVGARGDEVLGGFLDICLLLALILGFWYFLVVVLG